jgi:hypothetical protein
MVAAAHFSGEPEALSGEFFPFPLNFLLGIFGAVGKTGWLRIFSFFCTRRDLG